MFSKKEILDKFSIYDDAPFAMQSLDRNGRFLYVNRAWQDMTGFAEKDVLGKSFASILKTELKSKFKPLFSDFCARGQVADRRFQIVKKNKQILEAAFEGRFFYTKNKEPLYTECVLRDITEYIDKLDELKASEERLKIIYDNAPDAIYMVDFRGRFVEFNKTAEKMSGYSKEEILGKSFIKLSVLTPETLKIAVRRMSLLMRGAESTPDIYTFIKKDRTEIQIEVMTYPVTVRNKKYILGIARDISERQKLLAKIKDNEIKFKSLFESMVEGVAMHKLVYGKNGKTPIDYEIVDVNPTFEKIIGLKKDKVAGKLSREAYRVKKPPYLDIYSRVAQTGQSEKFEVYFPPLKKHFRISSVSAKKDTFITIFSDITEEIEIKKKLEDEKNRYESLVNNINIGVYRNTPGKEGRFLEANQAIIKMFQAGSREELLQHSVSELYVDPNKRKEFSDKILKHQKVVNEELELKTLKGKIFWASVSAVMKKNQQGQIYFDGIVEDITEMKKNQEAIKKERDAAKKYFEMAGTIMVVLDKNGKIKQINKKGCEILGYTEAELLGADWINTVIPPKARTIVKKVFLETIKFGGKFPEYFKNEIQNKNKEIRLISWHNSAQRDDQGNFQFVLSSGEDISDKDQADRLLKESESKFKSLVESTSEIIFLIDAKGDFILSEGMGLEVLGLKPGEVVGQSAYVIYKDFPKIIKGIKTALTGKQVKDEIKIGQIYFDIFYSPIKNSENIVTGLAGMAVNITERKKALDDLKKSHQIAKMGIWKYDIKHNNLIWSEENFQIFGASKKDFKGDIESFYKTIHPDDLNLVKDAYFNSLKTKKPYDIVHRIITAAGEVRFVREICETFYEGGEALFSEGITQDITEIKQTELKLKESEGQLRAVFEGSQQAIFSKDLDLKYLEMNSEAEIYLGQPKSKVLGKKDKEIYPAKEAEAIIKLDQRALAGEVIKAEITRIVNNKSHIYSLVKVPLRNNQGQIMGLCGIARDITEDKAKEVELQRKNEINKSILASAPFGIIVINSEGKVEYVNQAMLDISSADYNRFMTIDFFKHETYIELGLTAKIKDVLQGKSFIMKDVDYTSRVGKKTTVRNFVGVPTENNGRKQALLFIEDITELKRKEEKITRAAEEWSYTFDAMSDCISIHSINHDILNVNQSLCDLLGKSKEDLMRQKCFKFFHNTDRSIDDCILAKVMQSKKNESLEIYEPYLKKWLAIMASPVLDNNGKIKAIIHVVRDISDRKQAEEELKEKYSELEKFNKIAVDREVKMIELKNKIRLLELQAEKESNQETYNDNLLNPS